MLKTLPLKWALILKTLLLLLFSLMLIVEGVVSVIYAFAHPYTGFLFLGIGCTVAGLVVALLVVLSFITIENRQLISWLRFTYKAVLLLFGGWLLFIGSACAIDCGKYLENIRYLAVGVIVIGAAAIAQALPFIPAALRALFEFLMGLVLFLGGSGFFLFILWLDIKQKSSNIEELPGFLLYMLMPLGVAWLGVRFMFAGYRFFIAKKINTRT